MNAPDRTPPPAAKGDDAATLVRPEGDPQATRPEPRPRHYLLVFEAESAWMFSLPPEGEVVIGRGEGVGLRLQDASVSRAHAQLLVQGSQVRLSDLGSQAGTLVNEERIGGSRRLASGDVVRLGEATLVFHLGQQATAAQLFVEPSMLRSRVESELERSLRYFRPLTMLHISLGLAKVDRARVELALKDVGRKVDVAGWTGPDGFCVMLPELEGAAAREQALHVLQALEPVAAGARAGVAACPADGVDVDTLQSAAAAAAHSAAAGEVRDGADAFQTLQLGEHQVLIADPVMTRLYDLVGRIAKADLPVLVSGETGSGKELAASALHFLSPRRSGRLVTLNCAALQETLLESELFGHEKGAFTHAVATKAGLLEAASGGTLFLDEVGELSLPIQAKLLRALESRKITRVGDTKERAVDVRIVAATNRDLDVEVREGRFRQDLFFRLSGSILWMPPLRERRRELPILARAFLARACERSGRATLEISSAAMLRLAQHPWPGNVRELRNVMEYAAAVVEDEVVQPWHLEERLSGKRARESSASPPSSSSSPEAAEAEAGEPLPNLAQEIETLERTRMAQALRAHQGNQTRAAAAIGVPLRTFVTKMKQYGLAKG